MCHLRRRLEKLKQKPTEDPSDWSSQYLWDAWEQGERKSFLSPEDKRDYAKWDYYDKDYPPQSLAELRETAPFEYLEAQYHGGVAAEDIEFVVFNSRHQVSEELFNNLKSRGIKVRHVNYQQGYNVPYAIDIETYDDYLVQAEEWRKLNEYRSSKRKR